MEMRPVKFKEANGTLVGQTDDVEDLPVYRDGDYVISCWRIPFWKRLKVLFTGRVWLGIMGQTHAPLWIETEAFEPAAKNVNVPASTSPLGNERKG